MGSRDELVKVYADSHTDKMTIETFIPYCSMSQAQLSFHGHRDAVKFFVSVPGHGGVGGLQETGGDIDVRSKVESMLVMSGGEGYIDFRIGDNENDTPAEVVVGDVTVAKSERSHLVVWQVGLQSLPKPTSQF